MDGNTGRRGCAANPNCVYAALAVEQGLSRFNAGVEEAQVVLDTTPDLGSNRRVARRSLEDAQLRRDAFASSLDIETSLCTAEAGVCRLACEGIRRFIDAAQSHNVAY